MKDQFLKEVANYLSSVKESEISINQDEEFVDLMTEEYKLDDDCEAMLCVSITYIRSISVLIE